jgi:DNA-binding NtrC family response regulator
MPSPKLKVLLLAGMDSEEEKQNIEHALQDYALLSYVRTIAEMKLSLMEQDYSAIFCAWAFYQSDWDGSLKEVRESYPDVPIIVLSLSGEGAQWKQVLDTGAFDLLALPCPRRLALAVTEHAAASGEALKVRKSLRNDQLAKLGGKRRNSL